jgi:glutamate/tyrosine decarboxylase-like PLP-dependent enzyme
MAQMKMPASGRPRAEVLATMRQWKQGDADWRTGRTWSLVYYGGEGLLRLLQDAYTMFFSENGLSPLAFPSLRRFEAEVVSMTASMLGGGDEAVGTLTSGGSESILLAVKTARDRARAERPDLRDPEMVLPVTVHPAFEKAAHYFGVRAIHVPVDERFQADLDAVRRALTERTVLVVGSAPAYPHGIIDPIPEMAALAQERGICFHVDACLGGFLLPWIKKLGADIPPFDLSVPGVTSISADVHKYGFAAKGASTIIYRDESYRRHQFFSYADWPGGLYVSPGIAGTRPGGAIAAAWAVMSYLGEEGYLRLARRIMETTAQIKEGIEAIPELRILGKPPMSVLAFTSDTLDIHALGDAMDRRGWHLDRQQLPPSLHLMVTPAHEPIVGEFLADLGHSVEEVRGLDTSQATGMAAIYGMVGSLPDRRMASDFLVEFLCQTYRPDAAWVEAATSAIPPRPRG